MKTKWYRDICDGFFIISLHIQPSVNPSCSPRCALFHRCSGCHVSPFDICLGLGSHPFCPLPWFGKPSLTVMRFFFFSSFPPRTASHMNDAQHSASGKSCLECSPTSTFSFSFLFPSLSVFFAPLCLHLIFNMIGKKNTHTTCCCEETLGESIPRAVVPVGRFGITFQSSHTQ